MTNITISQILQFIKCPHKKRSFSSYEMKSLKKKKNSQLECRMGAGNS